MKIRWIVCGLMLSGTVNTTLAESEPPPPRTIDVRGGFVYNHGMINPAQHELTFTDPAIRGITVSVGHLAGVDPETGEAIADAENLIPLRVQSVRSEGDVVAEGVFHGDGAGLYHLPATALTGRIPSDRLPASGTWDASDVTIHNARLSGALQSSGEGDLFRAYSVDENGEINEDAIDYVLRRNGDTTELSMYRNGEETIRVRGDGSIYASGALHVGSLNVSQPPSADSAEWFIPETGDLSMGTFTQQ